MSEDELFSNTMTSEASVNSQASPGTGREGREAWSFSIPLHCGLRSLHRDLTNLQGKVKVAGNDCAAALGLVIMMKNKPTIEQQAIEKLTQLTQDLMELPLSKAVNDCETHRHNAANLHQKCRDLQRELTSVKRELKAAQDSLRALQVTEDQESSA